MAWVGFTPDQKELLDFLDHLGNNGWSRNSQTDEVMPKLLAECEAAALTLDRIKAAMASVGYGRDALHQLDRWESKRSVARRFPDSDAARAAQGRSRTGILCACRPAQTSG
jgi:hypothetical protein